MILIIGRLEREASPVNVDEKVKELKNPAKSLMPVPELPKYRSFDGADNLSLPGESRKIIELLTFVLIPRNLATLSELRTSSLFCEP
jgi:hypothetical protein